MLNAYFGLSNRINTLICSLIINCEYIVWPICQHCSLGHEAIFSKDLQKKIKFVKSGDARNDIWYVPNNLDEQLIFETSQYVFDNFLPDFIPEIFDYSIHARWLGYASQIDRKDFYDQANRLVEKNKTCFFVSDCCRAEAKEQLMFNYSSAYSNEITSDFDRNDINDQLNFCKDLKTIWASNSCLSNNWQSTITDMRSLLKKKTHISLGYGFFNYDYNYAISCGLKTTFLG